MPHVTSKIDIKQDPNSTYSACRAAMLQVLIGYDGEHAIAEYLQSSWIRRSASLPVHDAHSMNAISLKRGLLASLMQHVMDHWDMTVSHERIECFARDLIIQGDTTPNHSVAKMICHFMNYVHRHEPRTSTKHSPNSANKHPHTKP